MKKIRIVIAIIMVALCGLGWITQIGNTISSNKEYEGLLASAEVHMEQGLYQKAIVEYDNAYAIKNSAEIIERKVEAYQLAYEEGTVSLKEYATVLEEYCKDNEENTESWKKLINLYMTNADYDSAYASVKKCFSLGEEDEELEKIMDDVIYSFKTSRKTYTQFYRSPNGYITLFDDKNWGVMDTAGEWFYECDYMYAGPINQELEAMMVSTLGNRVLDKDGVTQAIVSECSSITKAYGNGYIPMQNAEGKWQFYSCSEDKYVWDKYEDITAFQNEKSLVFDGEKWFFIDVEGKQIGKVQFNDVKMYSNGEYSYSDMFVASLDGKYYLFDGEGEKITETGYEDMDIFLGEYIAYSENGKWGFVDNKGKVIIEPQYQQAKSFCDGLAAVYDGEKWGFINKDGDLVIDYQFRDADYFTEDGICFVSTYEDLYYMITLRFN